MVRAIFNHSEHILFNAGLPTLRLMKRLLCIVAITACHSVWADSRCDQKAASLESAEGIVEWSATDSQWQMAVPGDFFCYGDKIRVLKQRAAIRLLELSDAAADCPGERALFVPEQLAFDQLTRDGGGIEGDERRVFP